MKTQEAKQIIRNIINWQMVLMNVTKRKELVSDIDLKKYSLYELLKAGQLVKTNNQRKRKLQEYHQNKGHKTKGISISMMVDERIIAAVYTALHFEPTGEAVALINDICVGCVKAKYETVVKPGA